tara:strand:- start:501 stop:725 length:225 start_codon:yes stop_codon:yes gene_type:complete
MNTEKQLKSIDLFKGHEDTGEEHRGLLVQLHEAKLAMLEAQKRYKESRSDAIRFAFQDAIGLVYKIEKKLWIYQ